MQGLVGNAFYLPSNHDPGPGTPGYFWHQIDNGRIYVRNPADTAWVYVGNSDNETLGLASRYGCDMQGTIAGASQLLRRAGGDTSGQLQLNGSDYSLKKYMDAQSKEAWKQIQTDIASAVSGIPTFNASARLARLMGQQQVNGFDTSFEIPLPTYNDGVLALESECTWLALITSFAFGFYPDRISMFKLKELSPRVYLVDAVRASLPDLGSTTPVPTTPINFRMQDWPIYINWMIIGLRSR